MTLIEVIVAMALVGILSVGMLTAFASNHRLLSSTDEITFEVFSAQRDVEWDIENIKQMLTQPGGVVTGYDEVSPAPVVYGVSITSYLVQQTLPDGTVYTSYVAATRAGSFVVPEIASAQVVPYLSGTQKASAYPLTAMTLQTSTTDAVAGNTAPIKLYYWYVSRPGYHNAFPSDANIIQEDEYGLVYPRFPEDYEIIPGQRAATLTDLSPYSGRYVVCTVIPASSEGKMGEMVESDPIYVSGVPESDHLALHFDAAAINMTDASQVRVTGSGDSAEYYLKNWVNLAAGFGSTLGSAVQSDNAKQPRIFDVDHGLFTDDVTGNVYETHARYLQFTGAELLSLADAGDQLDKRNLLVFVAMRGANAETAPRPVISRFAAADSETHSWQAGWLAEDQLGLQLVGNSEANSNVIALAEVPEGEDGQGLDGNWHVLAIGSGIDDDMDMQISLDGGGTYQANRTAGNIVGTNNNQPLVIGGSIRTGADGFENAVADVAEILVYFFEDNESGEEAYTDMLTHSDEIVDYLMAKHMPIAPNVFIYKLLNETRNAMQGEPFALPDTVTANMTDGTRRPQEVTWSPDTVNTDNEGVFQFTGRSIVDPTKTMTMAVTVSGVQEVLHPFLDVEVDLTGAPVELPAQVSVLLNNGVEIPVGVTWQQTSLPVTAVGVFAVTGTTNTTIVRDVTFTLTVHPALTGLSVTPVTMSMTVGEVSAALVTQQDPADSIPYPIVWSSNHPEIATVNDLGEVTAIAEGVAVITATISHTSGDITATSEVTVGPAAGPSP